MGDGTGQAGQDAVSVCTICVCMGHKDLNSTRQLPLLKLCQASGAKWPATENCKLTEDRAILSSEFQLSSPFSFREPRISFGSSLAPAFMKWEGAKGAKKKLAPFRGS